MDIMALSAAVTVGGIAAGFLAATPLLFFTSPAVAAGLAGTAAFGRRAAPSALAPAAHRAAVQALTQLVDGHARNLLTDLLRRATSVPNAAGRIAPLVVAACDAARHLASLERHLEAFAGQNDRPVDPSPRWHDAWQRCERGRDLLTERLVEASSALSHWQASAATQLDTGPGSLAELAAELKAEARRQQDAAREVEALLA
jgi:hypothetical protein